MPLLPKRKLFLASEERASEAAAVLQAAGVPLDAAGPSLLGEMQPTSRSVAKGRAMGTVYSIMAQLGKGQSAKYLKIIKPEYDCFLSSFTAGNSIQY